MDTHRHFKDQLYTQFAQIAKAVANPHRFELLELLAQGERKVEDLAREGHLSVANASQHLQTLLAARLVESRKEGIYVFYRLAAPDVFRLIQVIRNIAAQQNAEIDRLVDSYLSDRRILEGVTPQELLARLQEGNLTVLDVRPLLEYQQGHIQHATSIPLEELQERLHELPKDQEIVAYCRGPYCVFADEAVQMLTQQGFKAQRLDLGYPDWQQAGLPTATS